MNEGKAARRARDEGPVMVEKAPRTRRYDPDRKMRIARAVIEVTVHLPDDSTRTFVLEATGLGGGRLRGRDRQADVERTLPVASIVSVASA